MDLPLRQRGRSEIAFMADLAVRLGAARGAVRADAQRLGLDEAELPDAFADRTALLDKKLAGSSALKSVGVLAEWLSRAHGRIAKAAFEEMAPEIGAALAADSAGATTLRPDPDLVVPDYFKGVDFHRTEGGWDGHAEMGFIHSELIFRRIIAASRPIDVFAQRRLSAEAASRRDYRRIFEMGASSGWFTRALADTFPHARITGCDLAVGMLREAQRQGNRNGRAWRLIQADAARTGEPDGAYDLVASYIILHEMPRATIREIFAEAFRILAPGGDILMADFAPLGLNPKLHELVLHYPAGTDDGEPWLMDYLTFDTLAALREAGFTDVQGRGVGPNQHPYVISGRKPG